MKHKETLIYVIGFILFTYTMWAITDSWSKGPNNYNRSVVYQRCMADTERNVFTAKNRCIHKWEADRLEKQLYKGE